MIVDSIVVNIPSGYEYVTSNYNGIPMVPASITGTIYRFLNTGAWLPFNLTVVNGYGATVPFTVRPTCSTQPIEYLNSKIYVRDYYYAYAGRAVSPPGFNYEILRGAGNGRTQSIIYSEVTRPGIEILDQTGLVQVAAPEESFTVRLSNNTTGTAPYTWLALPTNLNVTINQLVDLTTGLPVTPITYAGGIW